MSLRREGGSPRTADRDKRKKEGHATPSHTSERNTWLEPKVEGMLTEKHRDAYASPHFYPCALRPQGGRSGWMEDFREKHVATCTYSHVLQVNTHVTRCASLHCVCRSSALYVCMYVWMYLCVHCAQCLCSGVWHRVRACCALSVSTCVFFGQGMIECKFAESSLTPTQELTNSRACALHTPGRMVGVEGGQA